ncbi:MAG TPA: PepSY domain-containing protein, partial [Candidatus Limnocylindrales bacterium]|nr:PepSY domain-containing protein [Candidatus Limnocylindrales bacterium]
MEPTKSAVLRRTGTIALAILSLAAGGVQALEPKDSGGYLDQKEFFKPELYISSSQEPLERIIHRLPNAARWQAYLAAQEEMELATASAGTPSRVPKAFIDPRSGAATSLIGSFPLIPGRGIGNHIRVADLSMRLGRDVQKVDPNTVADLVLAFIHDHAGLLAIDVTQMGNLRAVEVTPELWQVSIPQSYKGIPVRHGRLAASLNNGNLVLIGSETWGDVKGLSHVAKITGQQALAAGFAHVGGGSQVDDLLRQPTLEIVPVAPADGAYDGPVGKGYKHRLVWTFEFVRPPEEARWEMIVDAHDGEVLAFQDLNHYVNHSVNGGVYPLTDTGICPTPQTCGTMQSGWPMPFADTGLASPNNFTNSGGIFNWTSGTTTTTLTGRFVDIVDSCGGITNSSTTGSINLGGTNNQHDCTTGGGSAGNTAASRSAFYEVNKLAEQARGWLPTNSWLNARLTTNVNLNNTCNAFWN